MTRPELLCLLALAAMTIDGAAQAAAAAPGPSRSGKRPTRASKSTRALSPDDWEPIGHRSGR